MKTENLKPSTLFGYFEEICGIPHPSKHEEKMTAYLKNFGESRGLSTKVDEAGNVVISKPATPGMEDRKAIILQSHMDMVCESNKGVNHDFMTDPIRLVIDGEWLKADGTTLGADNGIGVAAAMAILADKSVVHPPLEVLVTVDEETGMYGAFALEGGLLQGKTLLNLDSEAEGELYVGCAGGVDTTAKFAYTPVEVEEGDVAVKVSITGCKGGHSGCDIHLQRANANKLLFRFLKEAVANYEARLACVEGGSLRNAIPREASAIITVPAEGVEDIMDLVTECEDLFVAEYDGVEDNIRLTAEEVVCPATELPEDVQDFLIHAITACPHGVYRVIPEMPDVVETSNNLAMLKTEDDCVTVYCLTRSSVESRKEELQEIIQSVFAMAGAEVEFSGSYPGWKPNLKSHILDVMKTTYQTNYGVEPRVIIIHAGLECGIIGRNYPGMDMISFGPTIKYPHSPDERVNIPTVAKFYEFLLATLKAL